MSEGKISFKKVSKRNTRVREDLSEEAPAEDEDLNLRAKLEENLEIFKFRKRRCGLSAEVLLAGKKEQKEDTNLDDPFKTKNGGMLDLNSVKNAKKGDDAYDTGIGTSFSAETNRRDEDAEMQKFIEENLAQRKGVCTDEKINEHRYLTPEEAALQAVPEILRKSTNKGSEEMLSNQMLSGIPEVDLGLDAKIRNIEATEEAKQRILRESLLKKDKPSEFVPKNMAVNFVQHNRFNLEEPGAARKAKIAAAAVAATKVPEIIEPVVGGGVKISTLAPKRTGNEKATDDMHYEKFKKQFRRH